MDPWAFAEWDRYRVLELLGEGGVGQVFLAEDPKLRRKVALKFLRSNNPNSVRRLLLEAQLQAALDHPNICKVHEVGELEGRPYIALQFIEGETLDQAAPRLDLRAKAALVALVAEALHTAHRMGLVHRDIKPANIMLEPLEPKTDGGFKPYIMDFGLARGPEDSGLTKTGETMGTPSFMAPEQAKGDWHLLDRRSDVFSLGATLYTAIAGQPPFAAGSALETMRRLVEEEPAPLRRRFPAVSADLETIILTCLEKEPGRRYDTALALAQDLHRYLDGEPIAARRVGLMRQAWTKLQKHRSLFITLVSAVCALAALGGWMALARVRDRAAASRFSRVAQEAERAEGQMQAARLFPLHDLSPSYSMVRKWMDNLHRVADPEQEASTAYGLGRGYLMLGEYGQALRWLRQAQHLGAHGPEVELPLAQALGELYRAGLDESATEPDPSRRAARESELRANFRDPALALVRAHALDRPEAKDLMTGLVAFYEGRYTDAIVSARSAQAEFSTRVEGLRLEAESHAAMASALLLAGRAAEARPEQEAAQACLRTALTIARSDPRLHQALGSLQRFSFEMAFKEKGNVGSGRLAAIAALEHAVQADPRALMPRLELARAWVKQGYALEDRGQNPQPHYEEALLVMRRAVADHPSNVEAWAFLGTVWLAKAEYAFNHGGGGESALLESREAFVRAKALAPLDYTYLDEAVWMMPTRAREAMDSGLDPEPVRVELASMAEALIASGKGEYDARFVQGQVYGFCGRWKSLNKKESGADFDAAVAALRRCMALSPSNTNAYGQFALVLRWKAEAERDAHRDPRPALEEGLAVVSEALLKNPGILAHHLRRGELLCLRAELDRGAGRTSAKNLSEAKISLVKAHALDRTHREVTALETRIRAIEGNS